MIRGLLVIPRGVAGEFKHLSREVFHDSGQVNWGAGANTVGVTALAKEADGYGPTGKLEASLAERD